MIQSIDTVSDTARDGLIELRFPATLDLVVLARFTAATAASRIGFDVAEIEDLRLAVDELCISFAVIGNGFVQMEFRSRDDTVTVSCEFTPQSEMDPVETLANGDVRPLLIEELSEHLLDVLVDEHGRGIRGGRPYAWLLKRRQIAGA